MGRWKLTKYLILIGDGMADYPLKELGGKTPLQVAHHPHMDRLLERGWGGFLKAVPAGMEAGTDVAVLSILGCDPKQYHTGRGPLEAASVGVKLGEEDVAFRCNLVTEREGVLEDYSAGHIGSEEAQVLMEVVERGLGRAGEVSFHAGVSYRHLLVLRGSKYSEKVRCAPPHSHLGSEVTKILVAPFTEEARSTAELLNDLILRSRGILAPHPVNLKRVGEGLNPANLIWPWSPGRRPQLTTLGEKYGLRGAVISAVDILRGIGTYLGLEVVKVPGATGFHDTNYEGKADYALKSLETHDLVVVHVEAPDEASHLGDYNLKIKTIEDIDRRLLGRLLGGLGSEEYTVAVLADHVTSTELKTHRPDPVPFLITSSKMERRLGLSRFDEDSLKHSPHLIKEGHQFFDLFLEG